jgi:hypothetical protein
MASIATASFSDFKGLQEKIKDRISRAKTYEEASQGYTAVIYENYKNSIVIARHFATVPYGELPLQNKRFVDNLAGAQGVSPLLHPDTLVLSLVGTSGIKPEWNDRKRSQGHVGIPLVSSAFIEAIPMMSRLLKELGLGLDWIDSHDTQITDTKLELMSGMFYVADAATEVDNKGRKIIAAQDFVTAYKVKTVFGFGGGYAGTKTMVVTIMFLYEKITKNQAEYFASSMSRFRSMTRDLVKTKIFH